MQRLFRAGLRGNKRFPKDLLCFSISPGRATKCRVSSTRRWGRLIFLHQTWIDNCIHCWAGPSGHWHSIQAFVCVLCNGNIIKSQEGMNQRKGGTCIMAYGIMWSQAESKASYVFFPESSGQDISALTTLAYLTTERAEVLSWPLVLILTFHEMGY